MDERLRAVVGQPLELSDLSGNWQAPDDEELFALPAIVSDRGSVQSCWGPAGIQNWIVAPTALPTPTARLWALAGDRPQPIDAAGTEYRWTPWEVQRRHPVVSSRMSMSADAATIVEELTFAESGTFLLVFGGLCRTWSFTDYWNLPPDDVPQFNVSHSGDVITVGDCKTFGATRFHLPVGARVRTYDSEADLAAGRESGRGRGRLCAWTFQTAAGETVHWTAVQSVRPDQTPSRTPTLQEHWSRIWADAFSPGNGTFSGHLPALRFRSDSLTRLYYAGVFSLLQSLRRAPDPGPRARFATGGQAIWAGTPHSLDRCYVWGGTEGAATTSFLWELELQAPLLARLDPAALRAQLDAFLTADMSRHWGIDMLTGRGVGMWYGVNDGAVLFAAAQYLEGGGDPAWLEEHRGPLTVREHLLRHVARHAELAAGEPLADYGNAENILECVSSYEHRVASFNALAAWTHRFAARWLEPGRRDRHVERAERIERAVMELAREDGTFDCLSPEGRRNVRTCLDFIYVGRFLPGLAPTQRARMLAFFVSELETVDWMRALSAVDDNAVTSTLPAFQRFRADHQATGSYDGWPGLAAGVRLSFGDATATVDWLERVAGVTSEGPFGQAHWVGAGDDSPAPARKASFFNGNCYLEACGCSFATTLLDHADIDASPRGTQAGAEA